MKPRKMRRHLLWAIAVVIAGAGFLVTTAWSDYQDVLESSPVRAEAIEPNSTVSSNGAQVTVRAPIFTDSQTLDAYGVDDETQRLLVMDVVMTPDQELPDIVGCIARLDLTVDGVPTRHANRFSLSSVKCDGSDVATQKSRFVFVVPQGEISEGSFFLKVGLETTTWLRVDLT